MSSLTEWLLTFRQLHEKARRGQLRDAELARYRAGRDELARALLAAQRLQLKPGETPRQALRVARALQLDLDLPTARLRARHDATSPPAASPACCRRRPRSATSSASRSGSRRPSRSPGARACRT